MSIGDELMNGFTVDTNASFIARKLSIYDSLKIASKISAHDNSHKEHNDRGIPRNRG